MSTNTTTDATCLICKLIDNTHPAVATIQGLLGVVSALSNILTAIALVRTENIKRTLKICLIILTVMDTLSGIGFVYYSCALYLIIHNQLECTIRYFLVNSICAMSMMTVFTMTLERILSVFIPLRYEQIVTTTKLAVYLIIESIVAILFLIVSFLYQRDDFLSCSFMDIAVSNTFLLNGIPTVTILLLTCIGNLVIFCAACSQIKAIIPLSQQNTDMESKMNLKATVTTLSVVVPFQISYLPLGIFFLYLYNYPTERTTLTSQYIINGVYSLTIVNGIINPLVYSWINPELRIQLKRFIQKTIKAFSVKTLGL